MPGLLTFLLVTLAVARLTKLVIDDRITLPIRSWIVAKNGENGWFTFLVHCPWCAGMWISMAVAPLWYFFGTTPWFVIPCMILALSQAAATLIIFTSKD